MINLTRGITIRAVDRQQATVEAVVSTGSIDRHEEIILPSAFKSRLDTYRQNPILCWGHPLSLGVAPGPERLIGRAEQIEVTEDGLVGLWRYAVDENPVARVAFDLICGGFLKAYSIGGIPHGWVSRGSTAEQKAALPEEARSAIETGAAWVAYTDMELLEVSNVFVGSNRDALVRAVSATDVTPEIRAAVLQDTERGEKLTEVRRLWAGLDLKSGGRDMDRLDKLADRLEQILQKTEAVVAPPAASDQASESSVPPDDDYTEEECREAFARLAAEDPAAAERLLS